MRKRKKNTDFLVKNDWCVDYMVFTRSMNSGMSLKAYVPGRCIVMINPYCSNQMTRMRVSSSLAFSNCQVEGSFSMKKGLSARSFDAFAIWYSSGICHAKGSGISRNTIPREIQLNLPALSVAAIARFDPACRESLVYTTSQIRGPLCFSLCKKELDWWTLSVLLAHDVFLFITVNRIKIDRVTLLNGNAKQCNAFSCQFVRWFSVKRYFITIINQGTTLRY